MHMKKTFVLLSFTVLCLATACGPAAEDRQMMHARARVFQDSIANVIRTAMAEAEGQAATVVTVQTPPATPTNTNVPAK